MQKRSLALAVTALLLATSALASAQWTEDTRGTEIRGRVTAVDWSGSQVVIDDQLQLTIPSTTMVAMADVREGEMVNARYIETTVGERVVASLRVTAHDLQAP